jgi:hypothetical protein
MTSGVSSSEERSPGWDLEFKVSEWFDGLFQAEGDQMGESIDPSKRELEDRFDTIGWGLLFLLFGALALPNGTAEYASAAVVGAAMLGLNVLRIVLDVPVRWFSIILGTVMLVAGSGALAGVKMDVFVLFFVLAGAVTIAGAVVKPRRAVAQ